MSESGFKPSPKNMVLRLSQATSREEGNKALRGYLIQGHMNRMAEPGLRAQVCLASKCMLPISPHLSLWSLKYFILPFRSKFRNLLPFLFLSSLSFHFLLDSSLSPFLSLSCPLFFPSFLLLRLCLKSVRNPQKGQWECRRFLSADLIHLSMSYIA